MIGTFLYWIGIASELDPSVYDIKVKFMHPNYPGQSHSSSLCDEDCWEPHTHVVTTTKTPSLSSASGCQCHISPNDIEVIENLYSQLYFCA